MSPIIAERLFGVVIVLLLILIVADFIYVTNFLRASVRETETLHQSSDTSDSDIAKLKSAEIWFRKNKDSVNRVNAVVAESKLYQYQNQIIQDFNGYGDRLGIPIVGYSFSTPSTPGAPATAPVGGAAPAPAPASPTAPTTPTAPGSTAAPKAPTGVNSTTVTVTLGDKVSYQNFLNLLKLLEQNVTRMQVTNVTLTPDNQNPDIIVNPNIAVIVYIK